MCIYVEAILIPHKSCKSSKSIESVIMCMLNSIFPDFPMRCTRETPCCRASSTPNNFHLRLISSFHEHTIAEYITKISKISKQYSRPTVASTRKMRLDITFFHSRSTDPVTLLPLQDRRVIPNIALRQVIDALFSQAHAQPATPPEPGPM